MVQTDYPEPLDGHVRQIVRQLDANRREAFEERAAIVQYDGHVDRVQAERLALLDVLATYGLPCAVHLLRVEMGGATDWVLTAEVESATATLTERGGQQIVELLVRCQCADLAVLGSAPW